MFRVGIDIGGIPGHDVAGGIGIEIPDGQTLHLGEQLIPDGLLDTLGHAHHEIALEEVGDEAQEENAADFKEERSHGAEILGAGFHHRKNIVIHQLAQGSGTGSHGQSAADDAQKYNAQHHNMALQIGQHPEECLLGIFRFAVIRIESDRWRHYFIPPFCWE